MESQTEAGAASGGGEREAGQGLRNGGPALPPSPAFLVKASTAGAVKRPVFRARQEPLSFLPEHCFSCDPEPLLSSSPTALKGSFCLGNAFEAREGGREAGRDHLGMEPQWGTQLLEDLGCFPTEVFLLRKDAAFSFFFTKHISFKGTL